MGTEATVTWTVYDGLRAGILSGRYAPGMVLRQEDVARQFQISRVPLREAFSKLEAEGFLTLRPRRGYAVTSLLAAEIAEIFELRTVIEGHAGRLAALRQRPGDVEALEALIARMDMLDPVYPSGLSQWCLLNRTFHECLLAICRRPHLQRIALQLRDQVEPYVRLELGMTGDVAEAGRDHDEIACAFRAGDAELVGELCAAHCSHTARRLLDQLGASGRIANEDP